KSYPELAPDHLKNIEYDRIVHIETTQVVHARKKKPEDSLNQIQPNYLQNKR
ncbi:hypothetical protein J505_3727, partial [Acinetobacter baumannii 1297549]